MHVSNNVVFEGLQDHRAYSKIMLNQHSIDKLRDRGEHFLIEEHLILFPSMSTAIEIEFDVIVLVASFNSSLEEEDY